jgi:phosphoglycolate phosphatase
MTSDPAIRLVVFDCDGTLVDSQHLIAAAMGRVWREELHEEPPPVSSVRRVIGLSLPEAISNLLGGVSPERSRELAQRYREAFAALRGQDLFEPVFEGTREMLEALTSRGVAAAVATGKGRRGLVRVLEHHGLLRYFVSLQTADDAPSKPHPQMVQQAMAEAGHRPRETVVVGDTTFDVEMARAAGTDAVGVTWGYHTPEELRQAGARTILESFDQLPAWLDRRAG